MGERKVLNKYFPPDFDPSLVPRRKRPKNEQIEVRMMLPFSIQCATCGEYMYRGKKFNSRKEEVVEENYFGIRIYRFYIKCVTCSAEITFKTDPKRGDYTAEHGCQRNFEPWREREEEEAQAAQKREDEEKGDAMKVLENRTLDSKREMDILDALDEIKAVNQRLARVDTDALLQQSARKGEPSAEDEQKALEEDQALAREVFQAKKQQSVGQSVGQKRPLEQEKPSAQEVKPVAAVAAPVVIAVKKKVGGKKAVAKTKAKAKPKAKAPTTTSLVADYSDSD